MYRRMNFPGGKTRALTLSYDDGVRQDKRLIDIMVKNGLKGTFNINSGLFEKTPSTTAQVGRMTKSEAYDLYFNNDMEVATHSFSHPSLATMTDAEITNEILSDKIDMEKETGKIIRGFAYPNGSVSDRVVKCLEKCGFLYARTTVSTRNFALANDLLRLPATCHHKDPELMNLAKSFIETQSYYTRIFYLWGHSYEFDNNNNWNVIEEFAEYVSRNDDVWYVTNIDLFEYVESYKKLLVSADSKRFYNPTSTTLYFNTCGKDYQIAPAQTLVID